MLDEASLIAAEHARREAIMRNDADALDAMTGDTFHFAHINGLIEDRDAFLARIRAGLVRTNHTSATNITVRLRNGYALMTGNSRIDYEWVSGEARGVLETLFLAVWEPVGDRWKIVAYASTPPMTG